MKKEIVVGLVECGKEFRFNDKTYLVLPKWNYHAKPGEIQLYGLPRWFMRTVEFAQGEFDSIHAMDMDTMNVVQFHIDVVVEVD